MVAQPRYEADRPVAGVTVRDAQFFLIGHFISTKFSVQQKNTYNRLFNMTSSYLFRLRTDIISRLDQDSQLSLLPATSVARGKKSSPPPLPRFQRTCTRTLGIYRYHYRYRLRCVPYRYFT